MLHVTIPPTPPTSINSPQPPCNPLPLSILQPKSHARRKPARRLSPARVFTFVNKKPPSPTLFSAQKTGKSALDSHKNAYFAGSETASGEGKTGARQSLSRCFSLYLLLMSFSCQIVLNIIKISNKSSFVQTLFIIFAVFNHIEHDHIIEQAKKNEGK